jgi:succinate-semialdehyde dehydrogenase/glutarate-semialdehyde dehydrogenase
MGKLLPHAKAEVLKSASLCNYYYETAESHLVAEQKLLTNGTQVSIEKVPLGTVLGVFPWNFPIWQILRSAIPTIISGNAMLVKPAPNAAMSALALQEIMERIGLPPFIYNTCFLNNEQVSQCIANKHIHAVTFTGSENTGNLLASIAGKHLKPIVLELGGSDPLIIMEDADLPQIIDEILFSRFQNNGQSCVAAKRFLVHHKKMEPFLALAKEKITAMQLGDPLEPNTVIGPIARVDLLHKLEQQLADCLSGGAEIYYQQSEVPKQGNFFPPTILYNIPAGNLAAQEELFGPILSVFSFGSDQELIALANSTQYGLGASIYTPDINRAKALASQIESGMVYINQMVKSDPSIPFGGIKNSGFGRELGKEGLLAFCQTKTIWVKNN